MKDTAKATQATRAEPRTWSEFDKVLRNGRVINVLDVQGGKQHLTLDDIAHQLAVMPRFGGLLARPVTVAEHSIAVARAAMEMLPRLSGWQVMMALLHDAAEVVVGDIDRPAKHLIKRFGNGVEMIEGNVLCHIAASLFGGTLGPEPWLPPLFNDKEHTARNWWGPIKHLDDRALAAEWLYFMPAAVRDSVSCPVAVQPLLRAHYFENERPGGPDPGVVAETFKAVFIHIARDFMGVKVGEDEIAVARLGPIGGEAAVTAPVWR